MRLKQIWGTFWQRFLLHCFFRFRIQKLLEPILFCGSATLEEQCSVLRNLALLGCPERGRKGRSRWGTKGEVERVGGKRDKGHREKRNNPQEPEVVISKTPRHTSNIHQFVVTILCHFCPPGSGTFSLTGKPPFFCGKSEYFYRISCVNPLFSPKQEIRGKR